MRLSAFSRAVVPAALGVFIACAQLQAQPQMPASDSLRLAPVLASMERSDRRAAQLPLLAAQSALRASTLEAERLPAVSTLAVGQYVSDVPSIAGGAPLVPYQQYDAYLIVRQRLWDPTRGSRRGVEQAQFEESEARVRSTLWQQRQAVSDAFFAALSLDAERASLAAAITDLEARRQVAGQRVAAGLALPSEAALFEAELLRRRQSLDALESDHRATVAVLASLSGSPIDATTPVALPDLANDVAAARAVRDARRDRPEYAQFDASRAALAERAETVARQDLPRVSAFGRMGYGRPGINPLNQDFQHYWVAGVQVEWAPWTWGSSRRDQEVQFLQSQILHREEEAFTAHLERAAMRDLAAIDRLERTLAADDAIILLHQRVLAETARRHEEGTVTAAEYVDRETDLLAARIARDLHRVRLAEAHARFLTTLGQEIR